MTRQNYDNEELNKYCNDYYFKEYRVAIVITPNVEKDYRECPDATFLDLAEEQGHTFTLEGFTKFIESGELQQLMRSVPVGQYFFVRFIPMFQLYPTSFAQIEGKEPMPVIFCSTTEKLGKDGFAEWNNKL